MPRHLPDVFANGGFHRRPLSSSCPTYDIGQVASKRDGHRGELQKLPREKTGVYKALCREYYQDHSEVM